MVAVGPITRLWERLKPTDVFGGQDLGALTNPRPSGIATAALALLVLLTAGTLVHPYMAQQASRYALTAAVVERGTVRLDAYEHVLGVDRAVWGGHIYSDKAPGQPLAAVPVFALGRVVGVEDATILRVDGNLGLWWVTFGCASAMGAFLLVLMWRRSNEIVADHAVGASLGTFFGTMLLPFSALLFGHVMAAAFLYASYLTLDKENRSSAVWAGLLASLAVFVEYTAILGVAALLMMVIWRYRSRLVYFIAGGVPAALALVVYNTIAFGAWHRLSYQLTAFDGVREEPEGVLQMFSSPALSNVGSLLFSGRGLLIGTPVVVIAVVAAFVRIRKDRHPDAVLALLVFALFILLPVFWENPWGGDSPGPRYMTPMLPFLAVPLGWALERWRLVTKAAMTISVVTMLAATFTEPLISKFETGGLGIWINKVLDGQMVDTLWTMAFGPSGWAVQAAFTLGTLIVLARLSGSGIRSIESPA